MTTVTADSKTIVENLAKRGNRHAVWALGEIDRLTAENRELMIENSSLIKMTGADGLEIDRLTEQLQAVSDQLTEARALAWLWDEMGRRRISTIGFDWGVGMIMAFSSDGDCVEAETMQGIFAEIEAMGDAWA
jgi:hypothetical protein